jgi:hypothetical protein
VVKPAIMRVLFLLNAVAPDLVTRHLRQRDSPRSPPTRRSRWWS